MANDFTVFASSIAELYDDYDPNDPEDMRERMMLADAVLMYGLHGVEIELPKSVKRAFRGSRTPSTTPRTSESRPRRAAGPARQRPSRSPSLSKNPKPRFPKAKTKVLKTGNLGFRNQKPRFPKAKTLT